MNEVSHSLDRLAMATGRLLTTATALSDAQMRDPSLLPGWTRGHVLTHIARNADGLANLLRWARTGTKIPMYASAESRSADIEAGSGRPAASLAADVRESAAAFAAEAAALPDEAWAEQVRALHGPAFPAMRVLEHRLSEVEIHHVDLAAGYSPGDWPEDFLIEALPRVALSFTGRDDVPPCLIWAQGTKDTFRIGPEQDRVEQDAPEQEGPSPVVIHGQPADLLAWLLGRGNGDGLTLASGTALPELPPWR
jgi:maleylpyruvate isomerase